MPIILLYLPIINWSVIIEYNYDYYFEAKINLVFFNIGAIV